MAWGGGRHQPPPYAPVTATGTRVNLREKFEALIEAYNARSTRTDPRENASLVLVQVRASALPRHPVVLLPIRAIARRARSTGPGP
jgi:hypothetical protein